MSSRIPRFPRPIHGIVRYLVLLVPAALAGLVLTGLGGCGRDAEVVHLRFWNGFTGPDGRTMLKLVQRFNDENPDIRVTMQRIVWDTYYNKLFVAGLGGRAPEVFVLQTDAFSRFMQADFLLPLNDKILGENGLDMDDFDPNVVETVYHNGQYYAVPLDAYILGMFYNRDLFREAGIVDEHGEPDLPANREEFLDAARRITELGENEYGKIWGFIYTIEFRYGLYALMRQFGGDLFSEDGTRTLINSPENVEALEFAVRLIEEHGVTPNPDTIDSWIGFRQGRVGMAFHGIFMLPDLQRQQDLNYGAAPIPTLGDRPATWMGSHNICLRAGMDEAKEEAAWRFTRFLSENSLDWAEGGQVPVRRSLRDTERFRNMEAQSQFARQLPIGEYLPSNPFVFEYFTELDLALERALRGRMPPKQALDEAAANIETIMRRYGITPGEDGES